MTDFTLKSVQALQFKPAVQRIMDLARRFRSAHGEDYDDAYKALEGAAYEALIAQMQREPVLHIECETKHDGITGSTSLNVVRVEANDDGSFTAVTDYWPQCEELCEDEGCPHHGTAHICVQRDAVPQERRFCVRCGDPLMSDGTDLCYCCNQVMMQREAVQPAGPEDQAVYDAIAARYHREATLPADNKENGNG